MFKDQDFFLKKQTRDWVFSDWVKLTDCFSSDWLELMSHDIIMTSPWHHLHLSRCSSWFSEALSCSLSAAITMTATSTWRLSERSLSATSCLSWARCCEWARSHSSSVSVWASSVLTRTSCCCMVPSAARKIPASCWCTVDEAAAVSSLEKEVGSGGEMVVFRQTPALPEAASAQIFS